MQTLFFLSSPRENQKNKIRKQTKSENRNVLSRKIPNLQTKERSTSSQHHLVRPSRQPAQHSAAAPPSVSSLRATRAGARGERPGPGSRGSGRSLCPGPGLRACPSALPPRVVLVRLRLRGAPEPSRSGPPSARAPALGDSEAHTEYVQMIFFLQAKLKDTRLARRPFGEGCRRKPRISPRGDGLRTGLRSCSRPGPRTSAPPLCARAAWRLLSPCKRLCTPPSSASRPTGMNEDAVPVNSRSREQ